LVDQIRADPAMSAHL